MPKIVIVLSFLLSVFFRAESLQARDAELKLINGNKLTGEIMSLSPSHLTLKSKVKEQAQVLDIRKIASLNFSSKTDPVTPALQFHLTMFGRICKNLPKDLYKGSILSIDNDHVVIDTPYVGKLSINKSFIQSLKLVNKRDSSLYSIGKLSEWTNSSPSNIIQEGNTIKFNPIQRKQSLQIYKKTKFYSKYKLSFTLDSLGEKSTMRGYAPQLIVVLYPDSNGKEIKNSIRLSLTRGAVQASIFELTKYLTLKGSFSLPLEIRAQKKLDLVYLVDTINNTLTLTVNRHVIFNSLKIKTSLPKDPSSFLSLRSTTPITLSNMKLMPWSGVSPHLSSQIPLTKQMGDPINLDNGDIVYGLINDINDSTVKMQTQYGDYNIRLDKIESLDLNKAEKNVILIEPNDARLSFSDGSKFIINIEKLEDQKIWGSSSTFDGIQGFDINKIHRIEFANSIYQ